MKLTTRIIQAGLVASMGFLVAADTTVASVTFDGLGLLPGGKEIIPSAISADGSTVIGTAADQAFRWTRGGGVQLLGNAPSSALAVNANGSVIVGTGWDGVLVSDGGGATILQAYRWTPNGAQALAPPFVPPPPEPLRDPANNGVTDGYGPVDSMYYLSYANGVSTDGSVIVGRQENNLAYRWTALGGTQELGDVYGLYSSSAQAVSADGSTIAGVAAHCADGAVNLPVTLKAFRWTPNAGTEFLGVLPGAGLYGDSAAHAISGDGSTIIGDSDSALGRQAFRWTASDGMQGLGFLPGYLYSDALAASQDGSTIVGTAYRYSDYTFNGEAVLWDADDHMRTLRDVLVNDYGLNLDGWMLMEATGISADGLTIVGTGFNPSGQYEGWIASLPEPAALLLIALVGFALRRRHV